ncbi:MAG: UDP-2,3-diacylglucosamine hydrolase [Sulfurimonas sp.]|nr:UDP-2,3-diacylglucosamine hydrolase [Sulfurimonas sp.]MDD5203551.1 UDP-2,3-diacylglucosamine hydrolase [Sulfurimonas sp.]
MFLSDIKIQEGAFVLSDAHYSHLRPELLSFIKAIHSKELIPSQLILMGDIFDALFGGIPFTYEENAELITLLNAISLEMEVLYLEGNHDFNLQKIFPNIKVFKISQQPVACSYQDKKVLLAHGDFGGALGYRVYVALIRNPLMLFFLKYIDIVANHTILKKIDAYLGKKDDCKEFIGFYEFVQRRLSDKFICDYFIEGHFHQNKVMDFKNCNYINLGAFACNQRYFVVKSLQNKALLEEKIFSLRG